MRRTALIIPILLMFSLLVGCGSTDLPSDRGPEDVDPSTSDVLDGSLSAPDVGDGPGVPGTGLRDGAPCTADTACAGGVCITGGGWVGGYCSTPGCREPAADCHPGEAPSACLVVNPTDFPYCARTCSTDNDCRNGYACAAEGIGGALVCRPAGSGAPVPPPGGSDPSSPGASAPPSGDGPGSSSGSGSAPPPPSSELPPTEPPSSSEPLRDPQPDGEACRDDAECSGGTCLSAPEWPGGYCTTTDCARFTDCARGDDAEVDNRCLSVENAENYCVRMCASATDCRTGYVCQRIGNNGYCAPDPDAIPDPDPPSSGEGPEPSGAVGIGAACENDGDCDGLSCETGFQYPGGYCTITGCSDDADCGSGAFCQSFFGLGATCIQRCESSAECREGYACQGGLGGQPRGCTASFGGGGGGGGMPGFP